MHFEPSLLMRSAGAALVRLASIIDRSLLRKRADALRERSADNSVLGHFLTQEYETELAIDRLFRRRRTTGRWPKKVRDDTTASVLSFVAALTEVHRRLAPRAQVELEQRLYGGLKGPNSLAPIVHEMTVACHLMHRGWDVEFHDLEEGKGFDYVARNGAYAIEVECKRASADKGRKIHRTDFGRFAGPLLPPLQEFAGRRAADIVHLRVSERLPHGEQDLDRLRSAVLAAMSTASDGGEDTFAVRMASAGLSHPSVVGEAIVRQEIEEHVGTDHLQALYAVEGADLAVLVVTSQKRDHVLSYIYKELKDAAAQFSRQRPAVVWTYIEGIEPYEWDDLVGDTALQRMSHRYMLGERRQHVFSMAYSSTAHLVSHGRGHFQQRGPLMNYNRMGPEYEKISEMLYA